MCHEYCEEVVNLRRYGIGAAILWLTGHKIGPPEWLILEPTNHCNLKCPICGAANEMKVVKKGFLPREQFALLAEAACELGPGKVCLHARGEPLLHPHILELIEILHAKGLQTHLATNGLLLTPRMAKGLRSAGLDELIISQPGITEANYRANRGTDQPATYDADLMAALQTWEGSGRDLIIRCMLLPALITDGPGAISHFLGKWIAHPAVQRVEFTSYQPWPRHVREDWLPGIRTKRPKCPLIFDRLTLLWDGTITPCSDDTRGELALAQWPQTTLRQAFNCPRVRQIRRAHMHCKARKAHPGSVCRHCLLPYMSTPLAFAARPEIEGRSKANLDAWLVRKGKRIWKIFNP